MAAAAPKGASKIAEAPASAPPTQVRPEVAASVKEITADSARARASAPSAGAASGAAPGASPAAGPPAPKAVAKAAAAPDASAAMAKASAAKEKVKVEKPKAASASSQQPVISAPAQVPAPAMVGTSPASSSPVPGTMYRVSAPAASMAAPTVAMRTQGAQMAGIAPGAKAPSAYVVSAAATKRAAGYPVYAPPQAVEIVTRKPVKSSVSLPPATASVPHGVPKVGYASTLTQIGQVAVKAVSAASSSAIPTKGPPAVALGRSVVRKGTPGHCPVAMKKGKPATEIAKRYQIVFVTSEVAPWSKTGGLGEAMDGLPIALAALGHRVMTIAPRYDQYAEAWDTSYWSTVTMDKNEVPVHAFHAFESKVDRVFLDHDCFLNKIGLKTGAMLYGPEWGKDFADNQWRFTYFAKAVLKIIQELPLGGYPYGGDTIVAVNDWHSAMVPVFLEEAKKASPELWINTKSCLIIHNAVFQGRFDRDDAEEPVDEVYGLPAAVMQKFTFRMPLKVGRTEVPVKRCLNWLAGAVQSVDKVLTVSPTYAWELINVPEMGVELDDLFARRGVVGIVNGVKEAVSPSNAQFVKKSKMLSTFSVKDVDEKKAELKAVLQETCGLPVDPKIPLCIFVGRMDLQKGYDYLLAALSTVLGSVDLQLIIIGTGRADLVASTKALAKKYPDNVYMAGWCGPERYAMVAGADYNLMPSRWEPCGLAQMESMRFGTLPVVAQTGGLVDTVQDMVTGIHMGGAVSVEKDLDLSSVELMAQALERSARVYADAEQTSKMRKAAMAAADEFTWSNAALQYEAVFEDMGAIDVLPLCGDKLVTLETDKVVA